MYTVIILNILLKSLFSETNIDYFDPKFDESKNCKHEELMQQLKIDPLRCSHVAIGSDALQWEECKKALSNNLAEICPNTKIERVIEQEGREHTVA